MRYEVYALAAAQVYIDTIEADSKQEAWKKADALVAERHGETVRISDLLDSPIIEELDEVVLEKP